MVDQNAQDMDKRTKTSMFKVAEINTKRQNANNFVREKEDKILLWILEYGKWLDPQPIYWYGCIYKRMWRPLELVCNHPNRCKKH